MELKLDKNNILNKNGILSFVEQLKKVIFPSLFCIEESHQEACDIASQLFKQYISNNEDDVNYFCHNLENLANDLNLDLQFFFDSDPACNNKEEVATTYPGFTAIFYYRIAHTIYLLNKKVAARIISEHAHFLTGIDINPGATIGAPFFIDHGTGIVIGETTIIGNYVKIYQGVTLGALSLSKGQNLKNTKRHPTIGDNVTIYSNASILGGDANIGNNVVIGSNVFIMGESIPDNYKVVNEKPKLIYIDKK